MFETIKHNEKYWDASYGSFDVKKFCFRDKILELCREFDRNITALETIHDVLDKPAVYHLTKFLCQRTNEMSFVDLVNAFVKDSVAPQGGLHGDLFVQRMLNIRIMLPDDPVGIFPFHTGLMYGHGIGSKSIWLPLVDLDLPERISATMNIINIGDSRRLIRKATDEEYSIKKMTEIFGEIARPISIPYGCYCMFSQENIHGSGVPNSSGITRVSFDFRVAMSSDKENLARKIPGGYFRSLDSVLELDKTNFSSKNTIYLSNATEKTSDIPVHLQRLQVVDYIKSNEIEYQFELFELEAMRHVPTLEYLLEKGDSDLIFYSIFALPDNEGMRKKLYQKALSKGVKLHFINERVSLLSSKDILRIESYI